MSEAQDAAVRQFLTTWSDDMLLRDLGPRLGCREADALADLLTAYGDESVAEGLLLSHSTADVEGDDHFGLNCSEGSCDGKHRGADKMHDIDEWPRGRCDECGARCDDDTGECTVDSTHVVSQDEPEPMDMSGGSGGSDDR